MTDLNDDKQKAQDKSFKEQILRELEEANRLRKIREEELYQKELEIKDAKRRAEELQIENEKKDAVKAAELLRQLREQEHQQKELEANAAKQKTAELLAEYTAVSSKEKGLEKEEESQKSLEILRQKEFDQKLSQMNKPSLVANKPSQSFHIHPNKQSKIESTKERLQEESFVVRTSDKPQLESNISEVPKKQAISTTIKKTISELSSDKDVSPSEESDHSQYTRRDKKVKTHKTARRISAILISAIVVLILGAGIFGYFYVSSALQPVDKNDSSYVQVEIPSGSGNKLIGQILQKSGVIKNASIFNYYSKFKNYTDFQSGYYNLQKSMTLDEIATALQEGGTSEPVTPTLGKILITEGYTIKQISNAIAVNSASKTSSKTPFTAKEFLSLIQDQTFIDKMVQKYPNLLGSLPDKSQVTYQLEGYLFPATYNYYEDTTLEDLVDEMLSTMDTTLSPYYSKIAEKNMTVNEVLSMASLVEKEASTDDDRRNIASVFYNRLNADMPLQSNIAILYAMNKLGESTTLAEDASVDTSIDSPFNDYINTGLIPGPVDSPSLSAIDAVLSPASTDYLYFVADVNTGAVYYSETYEEHEENVEKYVNSQISSN